MRLSASVAAPLRVAQSARVCGLSETAFAVLCRGVEFAALGFMRRDLRGGAGTIFARRAFRSRRFKFKL
ncbi:MAG: hypothetical protein DBX55_03225 [Verrucomicrobia bacterium]|nr:MAG: hypothetical protein DBX55_03225 [Verrucomicrobiota bacterium]